MSNDSFDGCAHGSCSLFESVYTVHILFIIYGQC